MYDHAGRLTKVTRDGTPVHIYHYGPNGSRTSHTGPSGTTTGTYDDRDRLVHYGDTDYTYNAAGDLTQKSGPQGKTQYDYDAFGNLRGVTQPDGTKITYIIDGENRRVGKKVDGTLAKGWLYQDSLNPVAETDGQGNVTERFVYGTKPNVPAYMIKDGTTYRFITDPRGSVRLVVNTDTGAIVQRIDYSPFGKVITDTNPGFQPFGFAGGLYDLDTGLVRFGARDYDPETGRWTATDPIGFNGGDTNLYGYVIGDPVNLSDSAGMLFGFNAGEGYGSRAAQYWADRYVKTGNGLYYAAGLFAAAWTPCTSNDTAATLLGGGATGALIADRLATASMLGRVSLAGTVAQFARDPSVQTAVRLAMGLTDTVVTKSILHVGTTAVERTAAALVTGPSTAVSTVGN